MLQATTNDRRQVTDAIEQNNTGPLGGPVIISGLFIGDRLTKSRDCLLTMTKMNLHVVATGLKRITSVSAVQTVSVEFCEANKELPVTRGSPVGHIASVVTSDRPACDGSTHPWIITGLHGQRINLTLYDFTIDSRYVVPQKHGIA